VILCNKAPADVIYLDNNATTQPTAAVIDAVSTALARMWANPSGIYPSAQEAADLLQRGRASVAELVGVTPAEIIFTSGGTESIHTALFGVAGVKQGRHIITTQVEHAASLQTILKIESGGYRVSRLGVDADGQLSLSELDAAIGPDTALVSVMLANNETGVLFPVEAIAEICRRKRVLLHVDAVQAIGKVPVQASQCADILSFSGHKLHGPKGVGALFVRRHLKLQPLLMGGHQEGGRRAGTENVPGIAGFGVAAREALTRLEAGAEAKVASLRSFLEESILWSIPYLRINGRKSPRLPNTSSLTVAGLDAKQLVAALGKKGFCISNGSACASGSAKPSHVLTAMGMTAQEAMSTIRISLSADSTKEQIAAFAAALTRSAQEARQT